MFAPTKENLALQVIAEANRASSSQDLITGLNLFYNLLELIFTEQVKHNENSDFIRELFANTASLLALLQYLWFQQPLPERFFFEDAEYVNRQVMSEGVLFPSLSESQQLRKWIMWARAHIADNLMRLISGDLHFLNGNTEAFNLAVKRMLALADQLSALSLEKSESSK